MSGMPAVWTQRQAARRRAVIVSAADVLWDEMTRRTFDGDWPAAVRVVLGLAYPPEHVSLIMDYAAENDVTLAVAVAALTRRGPT